MRLSLALGRPLTEVLQLPALEIELWAQYERLDPFGLQRLDYHAAQICCAIRNAWRSSGQPPLVAADLMPDWGGLKEGQAQQEGEDWLSWQKRREKEDGLLQGEG